MSDGEFVGVGNWRSPNDGNVYSNRHYHEFVGDGKRCQGIVNGAVWLGGRVCDQAQGATVHGS